MKNLFHVLIFVFLSLNCLSQTLSKEAVFYNSQAKPVSIERKYFYNNGDSVLYLILTNNYCQTLIVNETKSKDTTIITEQYGYVKREKTKTEKLINSDNWVISGYGDYDSSIVTAIESNYWDTSKGIIEIADTIVASDQTSYILHSLKFEIVSMILNGRIAINLDSIYKYETCKVFVLNDLPVKVEMYNQKDELFRITKFTYMDYALTIQHFDCSDSKNLKILKQDEFTWNKDTSEVRCCSKLENMDFNDFSFFITKKRSKLIVNGNFYKEIEYLNPTNIFKYIILDETIYFDPPFNCQLINIEKRPLKSLNRTNFTIQKSYNYDHLGRLQSIHIIENKVDFSKVNISYK